MRTLTTSYEQILYCREASAVERCHVVKKIGSYNIGLHVCNMLTMLRILNPNASRNLIWMIVGHDLPERWTGDVPAPVKWLNPDISFILGEAEDLVYEAIQWKVPKLTEIEYWWYKGLDILELSFWAYEQQKLGNSDAEAMIPRIASYVEGKPYPIEIVQIFDALKQKTIYSVGELD